MSSFIYVKVSLTYEILFKKKQTCNFLLLP